MSRLFDRLLGYIAPPRCLGCDEPGISGWCNACGAPQLPLQPPNALHDVPVMVAGSYQGALSWAVRRFKYDKRPDLARPLAALLLPFAHELPNHTFTWVPVPLHPARLVERGFNQAALLAKHLARETKMGFAPRAVTRTRDTGHQARLERAERQENLRRAFSVPGKGPARVVLVDDVVTTGATARACIEALSEAGSSVLAVFALAFAEA